MEKLLTIVVPAYNVEKYIKNCLDSFIDLSVLRSLEILIVDDGSTDSTASLAHTYEQKYPYSFKVLSKENGGHGSTINYAIPRATGKYFKVVDGDDWLDKSLLPQFVQLLKHTHSDVISNDFNLVDDRTKKVTKRRKAVSNSYHYNREWGFAEAVMDPLITIHSMTIRTDVLQKNDIRVDEHCFYEDQEYILYPIPYCTSITFSPLPLYQYRLGRSGQSVDIKMMIKRHDQHLNVLDALFEYNNVHGNLQTISNNDKPYLSLGADLTPDQRATVLGFMGIELTDLDKYDVVYVNNDEEHKYLDSYISKSEIGTRSLSSVLITEDKKGAGLSVSTHNINYCTVGMYKNALATAGIADAKIIVAGPFPISGTAALVGTLKAYEEMTGKKLDDKVTDAAMDELVTTGELNKSIDGDSQDIEAMIADLKKQLADGRLKDESQIKDAIKEAAKDYDLKLSDDDIAKLTSLLMKLKDANIDWDSVINQAQDWASKLGDKINDPGFWEKLGNFFMDLWDKIKSLFS